MKKILYSFLFILIFSSTFSSRVFSQWVMRSPYPTVNDVYDMAVFNVNNIVAVTYGISIGETMITYDGGVTWNVQSALPERPFRRLQFVSAQTGYLIGGGPTDKPLKTTNAGINWLPMSNSIDTTKYGLDFIDQSTGWMMGFGGFIQKTTDGGTTWATQTNPGVTTKTIWGTDALSATTVFACASDNTILRSINGGGAFTTLPAVFTPATDDFRYIQFINLNTGFIAGERQRLARTTNGGANWDSVYANNTGSVTLYYLDFNPSRTVGLASGTSGTILRTTNTGQTWSPVVTGFTDDLFCVKWADDNVAYAGGKNGKIFRTTNAGLNWVDITRRIYTGTLNGVSFANNYVGFISGTSGFIGKSTNSGMTYAALVSGTTLELDNIKAVNENVAYVVGDDGTILKTSNGGTNWVSQTTGTTEDLLGIDFVNANTGFAGGSGGVILATTNGGTNWALRTAPESGFLTWNMDFTDSLTGWAVGSLNGKIYKTTNGGQSWSQQLNDGTMIGMYAVSFVNNLTGFASGGSGKMYRTTNGGTNWENTPGVSQSIWGIDFSDAINGIAVGGGGYTFQTTDGGNTWTAPPRKTFNQLNAVHYNEDGNYAWAAGNLGLLLQYDNPIVSISANHEVIPEGFALHQNYPNPFNPVTKIKFEVPKNSFVQLIVFDNLGREVERLINENLQSGIYEKSFDATKYSTGVYFYKLVSNDFVETKKMILVK